MHRSACRAIGYVEFRGLSESPKPSMSSAYREKRRESVGQTRTQS